MKTSETPEDALFMPSIITRVILPGIGSVCPECFSRGHIPALRLPPGEVYSFGLSVPSRRLDWDVDLARALIAARPRVPIRLDRAWLYNWLTQRTTITPEHVDHIPSAKLDEPGILVEIIGGPRGAEPQPFRILIDGTHRAARKLRSGEDYLAYLLTEREQRSICTYYVEGQVVEMPTSPGHGIVEREAGILLSSAVGANDVA